MTFLPKFIKNALIRIGDKCLSISESKFSILSIAIAMSFIVWMHSSVEGNIAQIFFSNKLIERVLLACIGLALPTAILEQNTRRTNIISASACLTSFSMITSIMLLLGGPFTIALLVTLTIMACFNLLGVLLDD